MDEALRLSERAVEAFLEAAEAAGSEEEMRGLQALAARAITRAASLRRIAEGQSGEGRSQGGPPSRNG
jgi:hypothetical protein